MVISRLRCSATGRGCKGGKMRKMGSGWIDEVEKCFGRNCLAKVKRIRREKKKTMFQRVTVKWELR
jgi:hypothetical protein